MVPDMQSAPGGVPHGQPLLQSLDVSSLVQYEGQHTFSTSVQSPQVPALAEGYGSCVWLALATIAVVVV
jgi:hypothetical protein